MRRSKMTLVLALVIFIPFSNALTETQRVQTWLDIVNEDLTKLSAHFVEAKWNYETNITNATAKILLDAAKVYDSYERSMQSLVSIFNASAIEDSNVKRQIEQLQRYAMDKTIWTERASARESRVECLAPNGGSSTLTFFNYSPIKGTTIFLLYVWQAWRDAVGPQIRPYFVEAIDLQNLKARSMNFDDWGAVWRSFYDEPNFQNESAQLFYEILPLYEQLHAYVRRRLRGVYRNRFVGSTIPAHILGNVMAEEWSNVYRFTQPFPAKGNIDVTRTMQSLGYDQRKLFQLADDFYASMGLMPAPDSFWQRSIFSRIPNRRMVCHPTSWDMFKKQDVRVRMCAKISQYDLLIAHHEMGHIQYFQQYADQPITFRQPPNPGFHESVGDTIALSAGTKSHLQLLGLLRADDGVDDAESEINWLYKQALFKVPFVVFSYLVDLWRWRVFDGTYRSENLNRAWWEINFQLMGVTPPIERSESDFDPAAKSHIVDGTEFARYFISGVIQFQFYEALCKAAGHTAKLHECNFYSSKEAGRRLGNMLRLGASVHWKTAMRELISDDNVAMSAKAILNYFKPLYEWLKTENARHSECYGWGQEWAEQIESTLEQPRCSTGPQSDHLVKVMIF